MQPHRMLAIALPIPLLVYRGFSHCARLSFLRFQVLYCASFLLLATGRGGAREVAQACVASYLQTAPDRCRFCES
jgi:hypothetical protein